MGKIYPQLRKTNFVRYLLRNFHFCETFIEIGFFKFKERFWKKNVEKVKYFTSKIKQTQFLYMISNYPEAVAMVTMPMSSGYP